MKYLIVTLVLLVTGCSFSEEDMATLRSPVVKPIFNHTGTRSGNENNIQAEQAMIDLIDNAKGKLRICIYGFSNRQIIAAVIRAHYRGVDVKAVGDARHMAYNERGYVAIQNAHIPMQVGNQFHIMHNKFFVIDDYITIVGTGNITTTGFNRNNNNWVVIESPTVAADFMAEWDQMFAGKFSTAKNRINNGEKYTVGDTTVEVYFSPQEDAMGRILEELDQATDNIYFTIFAFTKDQVGSRFIQKHREFQAFNEANGFGDTPPVALRGGAEQPKKVVGIVDRSQVHGNFLYHEVYRLAASGVPMKMDANENSYLPGDYQAGGGRLHSKTMIIDVGTPNARVITGSFNWSSAATIANDEVMLILRGERVVNEYLNEYRDLWETSKNLDDAVCQYFVPENYNDDGTPGQRPACAKEVEPGDIVFSEVYWYGYNGEIDPSDHTGERRDRIADDEFIELYNASDRPINLSLWTITNGFDFKVGFTPGTVIHPGQYFLVVDHTLEPFSDVQPQQGVHAFKNADFVMNVANDPRFPRLNIADSNMNLNLVDPNARVVDVAGDSSPPFAGGPEFDQNDNITVARSMERLFENGKPVVDGTKASAWKKSEGTEGGANVNDDFRDIIVATPGEENSN